MSRLFQVAGVLLPLVLGYVASLLIRADVLVIGETLSPLASGLALVAVGFLCGVLVRHWWAAALAPLAFVSGSVLESLVTSGVGGLVQGSAAEVVPLAITIVVLVSVPTAIGGLIGAGLATLLRTHAHAGHAG